MMMSRITSFAPMNHHLHHPMSTIPNLPHSHRQSTASPYSAAKTNAYARLQNMYPPTTRTASTSLRDSLQSLVETVKNSRQKQTIFVGGKGGVGKTSISSALAVHLAMQDLKVLVISTDPAHSLGDALDVDLRSSEGRPLMMTDPLTAGRLFAAEVNAEAALRDFRESMQGFDIHRLADSLGVSTELLESLGLKEFSGLLNNPPPGIDELVALGNVMDDTTNQFDVVIVDTAPTGHSLRLLALPQFLDGLLGKLLTLRMKLAGLTNTLKMFLGDQAAQERAQTLESAMDRLEQFRRKIGRLETTLKDHSLTSFLIVTIPTKLAVQESKRLLQELRKEGIAVNHIVVNQCIKSPATDGNKDNNNEAMINYYNRRVAGQRKWIEKLQQATETVSATPEYRTNGDDPSPIAISELPFFDVELVGVPALGYVGMQHLANNPSFQSLMEDHGRGTRGEPKVVICGGKGGVGKTTTSSALAVTMAAKGHKVCLISTDPAHSLGDAVDMDLTGGKMIDCPLYGVPSANIGEGSLSVMEIDPASALKEFKGIVDQLIGSGGNNNNNAGGNDIRGTLQDLESVFDTLPPGTDEIVALAKVVKLVKQGNFDRIVLDTAPTGHTTRLLGLPSFLADLIDRLLGIAAKVSSNAAVKMFIASAAGGDNESIESAAAAAKSKLLSFQVQMYDMEDLFANPQQTEFLIVTIPTELAVRESVRLLNDLTFESPDFPIKVRNIVVNQVLKDDGSDVNIFLSHVSDGQAGSLSNLEQALTKMDGAPRITKVRYLDTEPRGVFGLKILGDELLKEEDEMASTAAL